MQNGSNGGQDLPNDRRAGYRDKAKEAQESKSLKAVGVMLQDIYEHGI